jgi:uncharacterized protein YdcH (DUF465 family)
MSSQKNIVELFEQWENLNKDVAGSFQELDFSTIKNIRKEQRKIEDSIYEILLDSAPASILEILPDTCGEMELGLNTRSRKFYFLMEDPDQKEGEDLRILAITIDKDKNVETIEDFEK